MRLRLFATTLALISAHLCARADVFQLTFSGSGQSGSVLLTAGTTGTAGEYLISTATGTIDSQVVSLLPPKTYPASGSNENLLFYPASTSVVQANFDTQGVSFRLADSTEYNLYQQAGQYFAQIGQPQTVDDIPVVDVAPDAAITPEPASFALFGTGLLTLTAAFRRRHRASSR